MTPPIEPTAHDGLSPLKRAIVELRDLRTRLDEVEQRRHAPIAVVGMGCRFPGGANDPESYWRLLRDGVDAIREVPADRWDAAALFDANTDAPGKIATRWGGFLDDVDQFDPHFFGISPREAESMDPQQRVLLEVTWEALEHGGLSAERLFDTQTGVFLGISNSDHWRQMLARPEHIDAYATSGNALSIAAGRLAYALGVHGPALSVDTACSSSLVAVHLAMQSLRAEECDVALAGGVSLMLTPELSINFSRAHMLAADGRCKTFDARADGYVRGEGCGIVVLKRLSDALADGDPVLGVIRGSAVNQDGRSGGLTAPSGPAQEAVIRAALADAAVAPAEIDYVEAHGTGTSLGDPIEVAALGAVLGGRGRAAQPVAVGSVKTNVGHLEAAAGVAGLMKALLVLRHGQVPPHLHLTELNPHITLDPALTIPTRLLAVPGARMASISAFGLSGTNAHVVLEAAPPTAVQHPTLERPSHVLPLSATTPEGLDALARAYTERLNRGDAPTLADICFTAGSGRVHHAERLAVVAGSAAEMQRKLLAAAEHADTPGLLRGRAPVAVTPSVAFLFTGQGAQYAGMGRDLYAAQPSFRAAIDRCDALLRPYLDHALLEALYPGSAEAAGLLDSLAYAQPAQFALQYALGELWRAWGITPDAVAGHSVGEFAAACLAGVFSLEDGLRLVATRGRLLQSLPPESEMLAVFAPADRVAAAVAPFAPSVAVAAINGPTNVTIAGRSDAVRAVIEALRLTPEQWRRLDVARASHTPLVEPILDAFEQAACDVTFHAPRLTVVSSLSGAVANADDLVTPAYWRRHLRHTVRFGDAMATLHGLGCDTFVEIGPHPTLLGLGRRMLGDDVGTWLPSLRRGWPDWAQIQESLGALYVRGAPVDWAGVDRDYPRTRVALPTYPWTRQRYWSPALARPAAGAPGVETRDATTRSAAGAPGVETWDATTRSAARQAEQAPLDLHLGSYTDKFARLNQLAGAYVSQALRELGLFTRAGECHAPAELVERYGIQPGYRKLLERWLTGLVDDGVLQRRDSGAFVSPRGLPEQPLAGLEQTAAETLHDALPLLDYVKRAGRRLAAIVRGAESPLETLFPGGAYDTVEYLYHAWPVTRYMNQIAAAGIETAVRGRQGARILEVGAGTGGTTRTVLPLLAGQSVRYTFTDVSDFFLSRARERLVDYPFVDYGRFDLEADPLAQGFGADQFDVILAANAVHATRDLDTSLDHLRRLLAPGGVLVLYEATSHPRWFDVTTALIEGWQRFADPWRTHQPLLSPDRWSAALAAHGFDAVTSYPGEGSLAEVIGQHIILARADRTVDAPRVAGSPDVTARPAARDSDATRSAPTGAEAMLTRLAQALPGERRDLLIDFVRGHVARVLRFAHTGGLDADARLLDVGLDSLMAVELRGQLADGLPLERTLPATLVFDYPTIGAIAGYLDLRLPGASVATPPERAASTVATDDITSLTDDDVMRLLLEKLEDVSTAL